MKTNSQYTAEKTDAYVSTMNELPAIPQYGLPNWKNHNSCHRATAWAYLKRTDGGPFVVLNGRRYFIREITNK